MKDGLTRRGALALPLVGIAAGARAAPPFEPFIKPAIEPLVKPGANDLSKSLEHAPALDGGHIERDLSPEAKHDLVTRSDVAEAQTRVEAARSHLTVRDVAPLFEKAKTGYRIFTNVVRASADVVAILHGQGDQATVADLLDAVQKLDPEIATLTGIRQQAIEAALDFVGKANSGTVDLAWIEQGIAFTRTAVLLCDAQLHTGRPVFGDEPTYAAALAFRLAALAAPAGGQMSASARLSLRLGQPPAVSYDSATATLTVIIDGKTWTIDVRQFSRDVAKQLYQRLTKTMIGKLLTARLVAFVPGVGPYIAVCLICYDLVKKA
jgi:hypothetical protein